MAPAINGISTAAVPGLPEGLDGVVHVRTINGEEHDAIQERLTAIGEGKQMRKAAAYIAKVCVTAEGAAIWSEEEAVKLSKTLIEQLFNHALKHNGVGITRDEAKKD